MAKSSRSRTKTDPRDAFRELCDELRGWDTERLMIEREKVVRAQWRLHTRELALTRVIDERGKFADDQPARDGDTDANARRKRETAKKLEELPNLGNAAMDGELSPAQLEPAADLADPDSDAEVTEAAKGTSPLDLQQQARERRARAKREDSVRRRNRRSLRKWRDDDGYLCGRFELPLEHGGAIVESFFDLVTNRMRPQTGEAWEPLDRRQADVLIGLCQLESDEMAADGRGVSDGLCKRSALNRLEHTDEHGQAGQAGARGAPPAAGRSCGLVEGVRRA